jgi:hypothetical protein
MKTFKNILKTTGIVFLLIFIALCFGFNAHTSGYQITLSAFLEGTTRHLAPDFALNIGTVDQIMSIAFIIAWFVISFLSGKNGYNNIFRGMMIYSSLPFIGLIGYFFLQKGMKLGIMMLMTLIWGYPFFPVIITESSIDAIKIPLGILMFVMPIGALIARKIAKKLQY